MDPDIHHHRTLAPDILDRLVELDGAIFPKHFTRDVFERQLGHRRGLCVLLAYRGGECCGYKVGYEHSERVFYSFSGGVLPIHRRQGVARALMAEQHRVACELGYTVVRTHTKNRYREMLILNLGAGFDITGVSFQGGEREPTIVMERRLVAPGS